MARMSSWAATPVPHDQERRKHKICVGILILMIDRLNTRIPYLFPNAHKCTHCLYNNMCNKNIRSPTGNQHRTKGIVTEYESQTSSGTDPVKSVASSRMVSTEEVKRKRRSVRVCLLGLDDVERITTKTYSSVLTLLIPQERYQTGYWTGAQEFLQKNERKIKFI
jgi:hypothetical protein